ncbi:MAG: hypothetical protein KDC92_15710 [Bacteroidetes bacterium]|nr:hypothetical protein [Bacteroidota bacterium]MCB1659625.1 hypothetical protein [Pseudomonadales bacterium]
MGYYGKRRYSYRGWRSKSYEPTKFDALLNLFGGAVVSIQRAFLELDDEALDELFTDYGTFYGDTAEKYARKTFSKWQSHETKLSGQTMERLVTLVPPYLSAEGRFGLLKEVLSNHKPSTKLLKNIKINSKESAAGFAELDAALAAMIKEDVLAHIPEKVMDAAAWLYDDDITVARAMLAQAESKQNEIIKNSAAKEIALLRRVVEAGQVKQATYNVEMPAGKLSVMVFTPKRSIWEILFG